MIDARRILDALGLLSWGAGRIVPASAGESAAVAMKGYEARATGALEAIVVLGMHRSGTSLCMSLLQALGVRLDAALAPGDANNEPGYFESQELMDLNDGILHTLGATWHTVFSLAIPDGWTDDPALLPAKRALRDLVARKVSSGPGVWGFKDPRTSVLLQLYEEVFAECGVRPKYILCVRDPRAVTQSLKNRDRFPPLLSELLWLEYTMRAVQFAGKKLQAIVVYERWFQDAVSQAESLRRVMGMGAATGPLERIVQRVIAPALNHAGAQTGEFELACSRSVYESLLAGDLQRAAAVFNETWQAVSLVMGPAASREALAAQGVTARQATIAHNGEQEQSMQRKGRIMSQVFWRSEGGGFEEAASVCGFTQEGSARRSVLLAIPPGLGPRSQLRLDPADVPGIAQLFGIRLLDLGGATVWEWDGKAATLAAMDCRQVVVLERIVEAGVFLYLPTSDPNLLLPVGPELDKLSCTGGSLELDFAWHGTIYPTFDR